MPQISGMEAPTIAITLALFNLGGGEIILVLALILILFGARRLPDLGRGLGTGIDEFRHATREVSGEIRGALEGDDEEPKKQSGVVYEALTHDNLTAEFVYPTKEPNLISDFVVFVAQGFGVGSIQFAPELLGSLVGVGWFLMLLAPGNFWFYMGGTLGGLAASVWFCGAAQKILKQKDPPSVVLDQVAAVPLCFLSWIASDWFYRGHMWLPSDFSYDGNWVSALLIFALFRFFHVIKPWPIRQRQRLPRGWGITLDDVVAALYVAGISFLFIR